MLRFVFLQERGIENNHFFLGENQTDYPRATVGRCVLKNIMPSKKSTAAAVTRYLLSNQTTLPDYASRPTYKL